jgi:hypothetical protein
MILLLSTLLYNIAAALHSAVRTQLPPRYPQIAHWRGLDAAQSSDSSDLDLYFDASRQFELHQRIDCAAVRIENIDKALMRTELELLTALLIDVRRAVHREGRLLRWKRDRTRYYAARRLDSTDDLLGRLIDQIMIVRLQLNSNLLHRSVLAFRH